MELVYQSMLSYQPVTSSPPILDCSVDATFDNDSQHLSGLRPFLEAVKRDIDVIKQFLPPPTTNAPYLIAVWKEVLSSPPPILAIGKSAHVKGKKQPQNSAKSTGVKVDVVADNGHTWIRVNTTKNSKLLAEFREIDSYLTDSDDEHGDMAGPSPAQTEFDNSLLRTGRALLAAARDNPVLGTDTRPEIILCLTRIDPDATDQDGNDPRIALTIDLLRDMGLSIKLGERGAITQPTDSAPTTLSSPPVLIPTHQINLDLSILIALVSDLTHASLPASADAAHERFIPTTAYVEWKRSRFRAKSGGGGDGTNAGREDTDDAIDSSQHSRALAEQQQQEMQKGMLQDIHERLLACDPSHPTDATPHSQGAPVPVEFWTTPEARDRCLRIVSKIGGPAEKRRAAALFSTSSIDDDRSATEQEVLYWADSRFPRGFLPLPPIRVFSTPESESPPPLADEGFFNALEATCRALLVPHPHASPVEVAGEERAEGEIQRVSVLRTNSRLTTHTVQSMLCGAARGWTTLTANRTSVRAILREVKTRGYGVETRGRGAGAARHAALWIVDPRSLAEGMRSDVDTINPVPV
ncbi:hypothetical protein BGW80DRAFT_1377489 [Lactifluus volemus]|nr:hypothetical protein BGW80DRAFT_1377489 [Lactifluus volemus]